MKGGEKREGARIKEVKGERWQPAGAKNRFIKVHLH